MHLVITTIEKNCREETGRLANIFYWTSSSSPKSFPIHGVGYGARLHEGFDMVSGPALDIWPQPSSLNFLAEETMDKRVACYNLKSKLVFSKFPVDLRKCLKEKKMIDFL